MRTRTKEISGLVQRLSTEVVKIYFIMPSTFVSDVFAVSQEKPSRLHVNMVKVCGKALLMAALLSGRAQACMILGDHARFVIKETQSLNKCIMSFCSSKVSRDTLYEAVKEVLQGSQAKTRK